MRSLTAWLIEAVMPAQHEAVLKLCSYGAIQGRAFRFFESNWDHELAAEAAAMLASTEAEADDLARKAELEKYLPTKDAPETKDRRKNDPDL